MAIIINIYTYIIITEIIVMIINMSIAESHPRLSLLFLSNQHQVFGEEKGGSKKLASLSVFQIGANTAAIIQRHNRQTEDPYSSLLFLFLFCHLTFVFSFLLLSNYLQLFIAQWNSFAMRKKKYCGRGVFVS